MVSGRYLTVITRKEVIYLKNKRHGTGVLKKLVLQNWCLLVEGKKIVGTECGVQIGTLKDQRNEVLTSRLLRMTVLCGATAA
jgi:hypothetical protein